MDLKNLKFEKVDNYSIKILSDENELEIKVPDWCYKCSLIFSINENGMVVNKWFNVMVEDNIVKFTRPLFGLNIKNLSLYIDEYELHKLKATFNNSLVNNTIATAESSKIEIDESDGLKDELQQVVGKINVIFGELKRLEDLINEKRPTALSINNKIKYLEQQVNILLQNSGL